MSKYRIRPHGFNGALFVIDETVTNENHFITWNEKFVSPIKAIKFLLDRGYLESEINSNENFQLIVSTLSKEKDLNQWMIVKNCLLIILIK